LLPASVALSRRSPGRVATPSTFRATVRFHGPHEVPVNATRDPFATYSDLDAALDTIRARLAHLRDDRGPFGDAARSILGLAATLHDRGHLATLNRLLDEAHDLAAEASADLTGAR
jgi:hypothetical protein